MAVDVVHVFVSTSAVSVQDCPDYCTFQNLYLACASHVVHSRYRFALFESCLFVHVVYILVSTSVASFEDDFVVGSN